MHNKEYIDAAVAEGTKLYGAGDEAIKQIMAKRQLSDSETALFDLARGLIAFADAHGGILVSLAERIGVLEKASQEIDASRKPPRKPRKANPSHGGTRNRRKPPA